MRTMNITFLQQGLKSLLWCARPCQLKDDSDLADILGTTVSILSER
jgi:hypothetical protein